ncbi:MAG: elongation factor P maturation arginine rhamnosyltransferase EarP [Caldimonas sp.]
MQWDLYCRVVDNLGDIGVAWRLAAELARRGESVRLAVDDRSALAWMAPDGAAGVAVVGWDDAPQATADVVVELFGSGRPAGAASSAKRGKGPLFVNVEHLSAEPYAERSHGLPSPTQRPGEAATTTWFFFPGFTPSSGGLLREPRLLAERRSFGWGDAWLAARGIAARAGERRVSLFCYANDALAELLDVLSAAPTLLLATEGAAAAQVEAILGPALARGALRAVRLPPLPQADFDRLLWSCDLNCVRGEDSLVRAIWAGAPFLWQLYVQDDGAHSAKLGAFLDRFLAGASPALAGALRAAFLRWNGIRGEGQGAPEALAALTADAARAAWAVHCAAWCEELAAQDDLATRLIAFVESRR